MGGGRIVEDAGWVMGVQQGRGGRGAQREIRTLTNQTVGLEESSERLGG